MGLEHCTGSSQRVITLKRIRDSACHFHGGGQG
jgi:hypothetical protein